MNAELIFIISLFNTAIALIMLKLEIEDKDLENKKILFNLHSIENIIDNADKISSHKKEVFNGNYNMNQGFNDLISAYFYVENKVLNKNK